MQRFLVPLFIFIYWNKLKRSEWVNYDIFQSKREWRAYVVKVKGWRTALIDDPGRGRITVTFLFGGEK